MGMPPPCAVSVSPSFMRGTPRLSICACENLLTGFLPIAGGADPQYDNRFNDHRSSIENSAPLSVGARRYAVPLAASSVASWGLHGPGTTFLCHYAGHH